VLTHIRETVARACSQQSGAVHTCAAMRLRRNISALQLRDFLSGEFTPLPLTDVMAVLRNRESRGQIKLVANGRKTK
jgi:hypothetical protein